MSNKQFLNRLKRTKGQLEGLIKMAQENADCELILQQMKAIINALKEASKYLIISDVELCLENKNNLRLQRILKSILDVSEDSHDNSV